jgi:hypothetical protein
MVIESDGRAVRRALLQQLEGRGYSVAGDTVALSGELYVRGEGDRAAALFELKSSAEEAFETMYQGSWTADMPPRFAVLPASQRDHAQVELLRQAGMSTLFYEVTAVGVAFVDLEAALRIVPLRRSQTERPETGGQDVGI